MTRVENPPDEEELYFEYWECGMDISVLPDLTGTSQLKKAGLDSRGRMAWLMGSDLL